MTLWKPGLAVSALAIAAIFFLKRRERAEHASIDARTVRLPSRLPQDEDETDAEVRAFLRETDPFDRARAKRSAAGIRGRPMSGLTSRKKRKSRRRRR